MKKVIALLGGFSLIATSTISVVGCNSGTKPPVKDGLKLDTNYKSIEAGKEFEIIVVEGDTTNLSFELSNSIIGYVSYEWDSQNTIKISSKKFNHVEKLNGTLTITNNIGAKASVVIELLNNDWEKPPTPSEEMELEDMFKLLNDKIKAQSQSDYFFQRVGSSEIDEQYIEDRLFNTEPQYTGINRIMFFPNDWSTNWKSYMSWNNLVVEQTDLPYPVKFNGKEWTWAEATFDIEITPFGFQYLKNLGGVGYLLRDVVSVKGTAKMYAVNVAK